MTYDPSKHHRRSIRLRGYDYAQAGAYFVTICAQNRECIFGEVVEGEMVLSGPGQMVDGVWRELPEHYPGVQIDAFAVMPNHVHGIIILVGAGPRACPDEPGRPQGVAPTRACPDEPGRPQGVAPTRACPDEPGRPQGVAPTGIMSLPDVVQRFKSLTTTKYRQGVRADGWRPFPGRLWQRNYYERVIRSEEELTRVRQYIVDNPARWAEDPDNPSILGAGFHARPASEGGRRGPPLPGVP